MRKRAISVILTLAFLFAAAAPAMAGSEYITDASRLRGSDYTDIPALASALDRVFAGSVNMFTDIYCRDAAPAYIGSRDVPLGRTYYTRDTKGNVYSGTSCYIYANAVYSALFGDVPYHGGGGWVNSRRVLGPADKVSYDMFCSAGVRCGALLRTTKNWDGSYNSNYGHSVIILKYDSSSVTYLEGNGDGKGLIRVTTRSWESLNYVSLERRGYMLSFAVQPTDEYYLGLAGAWGRDGDYVGLLARERVYSGQFSDIPPSAWYRDNAIAVYELDLMNGQSGNIFAAEASITVAEAVALAARFLSRYYGDGYGFTPCGGAWYEPYYEYLWQWGIYTGFACPGEAITRGDFAVLMAHALPEEARSTGARAVSFPDLTFNIRRSVEALAGSGIINGIGGLFVPEGTLSRAEAAAVLSRMADRSLR